MLGDIVVLGSQNLGNFSWMKIRTFPPHGGVGYSCKYYTRPVVQALPVSTQKKLALCGDTKPGRPGRDESHPLSSGASFVWRLYIFVLYVQSTHWEQQRQGWVSNIMREHLQFHYLVPEGSIGNLGHIPGPGSQDNVRVYQAELLTCLNL